MNLEKGFKRLTVVVSILAGPLWVFINSDRIGIWMLSYDFLIAVLSYEVRGFVSVWIIYLSARWVVKGFREDEPKDEKQ
jgi:hypothetical protein